MTARPVVVLTVTALVLTACGRHRTHFRSAHDVLACFDDAGWRTSMANGPYAVAPDQLHTVGGLYRFHFWRPAEAEYAWIAYRLREQRFETWRRDRLARAFWVGPLPPTAAASAVLERCFLAKT